MSEMSGVRSLRYWCWPLCPWGSRSRLIKSFGPIWMHKKAMCCVGLGNIAPRCVATELAARCQASLHSNAESGRRPRVSSCLKRYRKSCRTIPMPPSLRVEGDKLQVVGITHDAPLARFVSIQQSLQFTRATFFAPTTRSPNDPGERFHIEARIKPAFTVQR